VGVEQGVAVEEDELVQKVAGWEVKQDESGDGSEAGERIVNLLACLVQDVLALYLDQVLGQWYTCAGVAGAETWVVAEAHLAEG
jgi:hypothetical protein